MQPSLSELTGLFHPLGVLNLQWIGVRDLFGRKVVFLFDGFTMEVADVGSQAFPAGFLRVVRLLPSRKRTTGRQNGEEQQ